jgi:hypothetical protein
MQLVVTKVALYPNSISVPLMPNYGQEGAKGMLHVRLHKIEGIASFDLLSKSDPYVVFEVGAMFTVDPMREEEAGGFFHA